MLELRTSQLRLLADIGASRGERQQRARCVNSRFALRALAARNLLHQRVILSRYAAREPVIHTHRSENKMLEDQVAGLCCRSGSRTNLVRQRGSKKRNQLPDGLVNLVLGVVIVGRDPKNRGQVAALSIKTGAGSLRCPDDKSCL